MSVALKFQGAYTPPIGTVLLQFGATSHSDHDRSFSFAATLSAPAGGLILRHVSAASFAVTFGAPVGAITIDYDANVFRGAIASHGGAWQEATAAPAAVAPAWREAPNRRHSARAAWKEASRRTTLAESRWRAFDRATVRKVLAWGYGRVADATAAPSWLAPPRQDSTDEVVWGWALPRRQSTDSAFSYPPRRDSARALPWREAIVVPARMIGLPVGGAIWMPLGVEAPWQYATQPPYGASIPPTHPVEPPELYIPDLRLIFQCPPLTAPWVLRFGRYPCGGQSRVVPSKKVYIVLDAVSLNRVSDNADIPVSALALAIDTDSWAWSLRATLACKAALALVRNDSGPVEIEATINGFAWRALIDSWQVSRAWASGDYTVTGRSLAAALAAPYARPRTYTLETQRTAQQLADQELPASWTLDWNLPTWLVPAGAWSYSDRTPIEAIVAIAEAAGGYIQAHRTDRTLIADRRYPAAVWDWDAVAPDVSIPLDLITQVGSDWQPKPQYTGVYVSGRDQGVLARIYRTGTSGDAVAPMVVDPLITEVAPAITRGTSELSSSGRQSRETVTLPLDAALAGLLSPGQLLAVIGAESWRGLVRGVNVAAGLSGRNLRVTQTVDVERHYA